ncbi:MAG: hypothetical protein A2W72_18105 [Burkholderiales bacterium RIFCSPLOWO2_12_67_14]|nr:MAG: hypothetical protein A3I64_07145 [Burkholderiales bacterium RIFCSPLOWO2_02_FULL_67_64]OGB40014.1 MAG: hypothetical protein A3E51_05430 [Burkholderiales bacterium RIFCSPHIGHO2_12_FULL_67_38]OGB49691.1 MAG: hypothetical protein A2W72_18105 [Burkholderiales bacterium RIFCSPLOWO2_12_67_14]OGB87199.1 MAG: hypothetical protein A3G82_19515 [Burkholderiales bacterium RIFCSPLOWO2_12_FULL_67_210]
MSNTTPIIEAGRSGSGRVTATFVQNLKRKAKTVGRSPGVSYAKALDMVAVEAGFHHWHDVAEQHKVCLQARDGSTA